MQIIHERTAMQHYAEDKQILAKQNVLLENLTRIGHVTPETVLPPLTGLCGGSAGVKFSQRTL